MVLLWLNFNEFLYIVPIRHYRISKRPPKAMAQVDIRTKYSEMRALHEMRDKYMYMITQFVIYNLEWR